MLTYIETNGWEDHFFFFNSIVEEEGLNHDSSYKREYIMSLNYKTLNCENKFKRIRVLQFLFGMVGIGVTFHMFIFIHNLLRGFEYSNFFLVW